MGGGSRLQGGAGLCDKRLDDAVALGGEHVLHLHRLDHGELLDRDIAEIKPRSSAE